MLKLDKRIEYALIVLKHLDEKRVTKAREVSEAYGLPYPMVAKVMHRLAVGNFLISKKGVEGGFSLSKEKYKFLDLINLMTGPVAATKCQRGVDKCSHFKLCSIKTSMNRFNEKVMEFCQNITIEELIA